MRDEFRLVIPASEPMLLVARMALAGLCSQYGADADTLDDIRTLSDEACYCLMHQGREADLLHIAARVEGSSAHIHFEAEHRQGAQPPAKRHDPEIARGILRTLATDVQIVNTMNMITAIDVEVNLRAWI